MINEPISLYVFYPSVFLLSLGLSLYLMPGLLKAAVQWGMVDRPDGRLKHQAAPVPFMGGIVIFLSFLITLAVATQFSPFIVGSLLGGTVIIMVGLIDDFGKLRPGQKFVGQILASLIMIKAGVHMDLPLVEGNALANDAVNIVITLFWYLSITNAINLIDIMDGLSGSVTLAACAVMTVLAFLNHSYDVAALSLGLGGAILGFLRYNWKPARVYLGDTGSMFIGLILGALSVMLRYSTTNVTACVGPVLIMGVPLFDTLLVMIARKRKGKSPFLGGPEHTALQLRRRGMSEPSIALLAGGATLLLGGLAVVNTMLSEAAGLVVVGASVVLGLVCLVLMLKLEQD